MVKQKLFAEKFISKIKKKLILEYVLDEYLVLQTENKKLHF